METYIQNAIGRYHDAVWYINLSNGVEALNILKQYVPKNEIRFVNIQSTKLEQMEFDSTFSILGADLLMNLAVGKTCVILDYGTNRKNSRAVYMGIPFIKYVLEKIWFGETKEEPVIYHRNSDDIKMKTENLFMKWLIKLDRNTKRLLKRYRKFSVLNEDKEVNLIGISVSTDKDGNANFQLEEMNKFINN